MPQLRNRKLQETKGTPPKPLFPMRINKYLATKNFSTRRGADALIENGKVFINGQPAVLGDKVQETDTVEVRQKSKHVQTYSYIAFNKPIGTTTGAEKGNDKDIIGSLPKELIPLKLFPVGRLDKDSHGLIILTNDGRVTDRLLNPIHEHTKEYEVTTAKPLRDNFKEKLENGINIEGYTTKPASVKKLSEKKFLITLTEGKTHQIRRMVSALFNEVTGLKRTKIMNIKLGTTPTGNYRKIEGDELTEFLQELGLLN